MQQTILAVLALLTVTNFLHTRNRDVIRTYNKLVDDELEITAGSVAMHVLELIGNRSFDSRTTPDQVNSMGMLVGTTGLTKASAFGSMTNCDLDEPFKDFTPCLDIDDVHMDDTEWQEVPFRLRNGNELRFDVQAQVFYVNPLDLDSPLPPGLESLHKKVIVKVRSKHHAQQNRFPEGFVRIERVFSYDSRRAENRLIEKYGVPVVDPLVDPIVDPVVDPPVDDPDIVMVTVCHRAVENGIVVWTTTSVEEIFVNNHIGHGDTLGAC